MLNQYLHRLKLGAASAALAGAGLSGIAAAQTLPIAGNPQEAAAQDRDSIRGVREQDEAAVRTANSLNRDARQEARQALNSAASDQAVRQGTVAADPLLQSGLMLNQVDPNHLVVSQVFPRTPAFYAGLRQGDIINYVNGSPISSRAALVQALSTGGLLNMQVNRNGHTQQFNFQTEDSARTAMRPGATQPVGSSPGVQAVDSSVTQTGARQTATSGQAAVGNVRTMGTTGQSVGQGNLSTGANTVNQVDQSGLNTRGTVTPATSTAVPTTVPSLVNNPSNLSGPTNASAIGPPGPTLSTSPGVLSANNPANNSGTLNANQSAPSGFGTVTPGFTGPAQLPGGAAGAGLIGNPVPSIGGTGVGGLGTSGLSPANPAVPAFGSAGAQGATGTTGGTGSTAGGIGAVGGTGATIGGTGSTAGPSGGSSALGGGVGTAGGTASGVGTSGAGGSGAGGAGAGGAGGGAGAGGT